LLWFAIFDYFLVRKLSTIAQAEYLFSMDCNIISAIGHLQCMQSANASASQNVRNDYAHLGLFRKWVPQGLPELAEGSRYWALTD
jgi:hypothetical protein